MATGTKRVWVELGLDALPVRIFRNQKASLAQGWRQSWVYADAVSTIRHKCWIRSRGYCELCSDFVREETGQMHEKIHRGKGGEISLDNSVFICARCHQIQHKDRNPRWSRRLTK